jgi:hypothetical protein
VEARVVAPTFVSDPFAVVVDVRSFRMTLPIVEGTPGPVLVRVAVIMISRRTVARNVSAADVVVAVATLRHCRQGEEQDGCKNSGK